MCYTAHVDRNSLTDGLFDIVETDMKKNAIRVGDLVRVKQANGEPGLNRYEVVSLGPQANCVIRQWPGRPDGKNYAGQPFDTSMLIVDNSGPRLLAELLPKVG